MPKKNEVLSTYNLRSKKEIKQKNNQLATDIDIEILRNDTLRFF